MVGHLASIPPRWCEALRETGLLDRDFRNLWLLMGLYAHRNTKTGQCSPSIDRLAILLGIGKANVLEGVQNLQTASWLRCRKIPTANKRERYEYELADYSHERGTLLFSSTMFTSGLWAFLTPSERKAWLKLRAHSIHGANVVPDAFCGSDIGLPSEGVLDSLNDSWHWSDFWFIPEHVLEPEEWARQLRMCRRTLTDSIKGLERLHMLTLATTVCADGEPGLVLLVDPKPPDSREWQEHLSSFQARLSDSKRMKSSLAAKRLMLAVKNNK